MAIGDAFGVTLGTAATDRQPSSGVEEQLTAVLQNGNTDASNMFDGTTAVQIFTGGATTNASPATTTGLNLAIMNTNSVYIRKTGTTDKISFFGVQTNA